MPVEHPFICRLPFPALPAVVKENQREIGTYLAGALFAVGWWFFVDGLVFAGHHPDFPARVGVEDYLPGIFCTVGMLITNSIDLSLLRDDHFGYSGNSGGLAGRAKFTLFIGIALIAGGLAGSVASLCIKYIASGVANEFIYTGVAVIVQTVLITLSSIVLWLVHNSEAEGQYNFVLN
ncbi:Vacuolar protein sorting-associated protein 68 [Tieghemiomyces parasiticus]|uniref:Vacuolar protein sorting-associated protein 68 n=1 Tax=Tieghemiomyces parasiticus TaxID=78921 RepID=A0A9W8A2E2_9FUNG|nr:Vacuolar protein sorting-associated protein 68 [Tieghemiomyces parasiticus]